MFLMFMKNKLLLIVFCNGFNPLNQVYVFNWFEGKELFGVTTSVLIP